MIATVAILLSLLADAASVQFNGKTCALPAGAYATTPLLLPVCGSYFTCQPGSEAYLASATLVVQTMCVESLFINGFDLPAPGVSAPGLTTKAPIGAATHGDGPWQSLSPNSSRAAEPRARPRFAA